MGISSDNHVIFNIHSGIRLSGVNHTDSTNGKAAAVKHGSKSVKSNNQDSGNELLMGGLLRNKAATVDLSTEGRNLSRKLKEEKLDELKEKTYEARNDLDRVDALNSKLRNGDELTDEDREFINEELKKISSQNYTEKRFYVFGKQDFEDAKVMAALKEHMIQRIQIYSDMQKELEAHKDSDDINKTAQMVAEAEQEQNQKKRIVDILKETLVDDEEEEEALEHEKEVASSNENSEAEGSGIIEFENEEQAVKSSEDILKFRAIDLIDKNKEQIDNMFSQSQGETEEIRELNNKMDAELIRSYDLLTNDELSEEEKLEEFNKSYKYMDNLFFEKRIDTVKSKLDFDTWLISKIEFNSHNNLHEVLKDDDVINPMGGIDMVREFLTSADAF
ncbi:hypothetical protein [Butyrivibrio sp. WCD3002]|uniref:hypothetical protein n=1 Tax=Butyrivibrio sp. WCD3002 TaxID=1280676 RepID=UPI0004143737|nr:hypothetical protein [Butyrivibrio sp. WCD3002]